MAEPRSLCPMCPHSILRIHQGRLLCDRCQGMLLELDDVGRAIFDMTGITPTFEFIDEQPGKRPCPRCTQPMTTLHLRVVLGDEIAKPRPELDRCAEHGIWFDGEELAKVFEKSYAKVTSHGGGGGWRSSKGVPEWWGGGHGGSW